MQLSDFVTIPVDPVAKAKLIAKAVGVLLLLAALIAGGIWLKNRLDEAPKQKAAQAQLNGRISDAADATNTKAVADYAEHVRTNETIKEKETHYVETIHDAPGANDAVPAALHGAGIDAINGLRAASGDNPAAAAVPRPSN